MVKKSKINLHDSQIGIGEDHGGSSFEFVEVE